MARVRTKKRCSRVTLAMAGGGSAHHMISIAGSLAQAENAHLHALLIEDKALFDLAKLPFASAVSGGSAQKRTLLTMESLETAFAHEERTCRKLMSTSAAHAGFNWSFERRRAHILEVLAGARHDELFLLEVGEGADALRSAFVSLQQRRKVIGGFGILRPGAYYRAGPVLIIIDADSENTGALHFAQNVAQQSARPFNVLLLCAEGANSAANAIERIKSICGESQPHHIGLVSFGSESQLRSIISRQQPSLIIAAPDAWPFDDPETALRLMQEGPCPIILPQL